jgi:hypothetical protein
LGRNTKGFGTNGTQNGKPMKEFVVILTLIAMAGTAAAGTFRVSYTLAGAGKRITVVAESTAEARRTVQDLFPGAVATGAHRVGK